MTVLREVHRAALAVGQAAVVEHLQQDVEDVGVRLLDLVEEHDGVGPAADGLGELAALVVADVAREARRSGGPPCASPCTRTCRGAPCACSSSNRNSASARASSVLPTPVGPRKRNEPIGPARVAEAGARAADRVGHEERAPRPGRPRARAGGPPCGGASPSRPRACATTGMPVHLATTSAMSSASTSSFSMRLLRLQLGELLVLVVELLLELGERRRSGARRPCRGRPCAVRRFDLEARLLDLLLEWRGSSGWPPSPAASGPSCRPTVSRRSASSFSTLASRSCEALSVSFLSAWRSISSWMSLRSTSSISVGMRVDLDAQARGGLVHQVDGLVGQEAVGDVAVRERGRGHERGVLDAHAVVDLVALLEAAQDGDRVLDARARRRRRAGSAARARRPSRCASGTR